MSKKKKSNRNKVAPPQIQREPIVSPQQRHGRLKFLALLALLLLAAIPAIYFYFGKSRTSKVAGGAYKNYNILLVTLDTLRADHLPIYGYQKVRTPNLDTFGSKSFIFTNAISHVPLTLPAHASILTGLLPGTHGIRDNGGYFLDPKITTLAEVLQKNGYETSAFVSAFVLDSRAQLDQGFKTYSDNFSRSEHEEINPRDIFRHAEDTEVEFEKWMDRNHAKPFFGWIHFYDPHDPYEPPGIYKTEYSANPYDGEIAYTDEIFGRVIRKLEQMRLKDRTIVIVTGDHGEGLEEHQERTHAMFIYDTTQHVPLLIHIPGVVSKTIDDVVGHVDIVPTIYDLIGVKSGSKLDGSSLLSLINHGPDGERYAYSESYYAELHYGWSPLLSITSKRYKYIDAPRAELYDRIQDPQEIQNRFGEQPQIAKVLKTQLEEIRKTSTASIKGPGKMDPDAEEKLRALGYISGNVPSTAESRRIDPKDKIVVARRVEEALGATLMKNYPLAIQLIEPVLTEEPDMVEANFAAGVAYAGVQQYQKAIDHFMKTIRVQPDHIRAIANMAFAYQMMGDLKSAEFWYQKVLKRDETHPFTISKLAHLYRQMNDPKRANFYYQRAVQFYETSLQQAASDEGKAGLYSTLAEIHFNAGEMERAEKALKSAIQLEPNKPQLHYNLALVYEFRKEPSAAALEYQKETAISPGHFMAWNNLGILYVQLNRLPEAADCFQKVVQLIPNEPQAYYFLASTYKKMGRDKEADEILRRAQQLKKGVA